MKDQNENLNNQNNQNNQKAGGQKGSSQNPSMDEESTKHSRQGSHTGSGTGSAVEDEEEFKAGGRSSKEDTNIDQSAGSKGRTGGVSQDQNAGTGRNSRGGNDMSENEDMKNPAPSRQGSKDQSPSSSK